MEEDEDYEDEDRQPRGAGAYAARDTYASSIKELTDPSNDLARFEMKLRSLKLNMQGEVIPVGKPLANEKGINAIMGIVESIVNHTNTLGNFNKDLMEFFFDTVKGDIITDIMVNRKAYEIDRKNRDLIVGDVIRFSLAFSTRPYEEGDKRFWKGSVSEIHHKQETSNKPRQGFSLNPFNWRK